MTTGCFLSWPLDADPDRVRETVLDALADSEESGVARLLPDADALTVSVFLHTRNEPRLAWYVEHGGSGDWRDPAAVVRERSPLFAALESLLVDAEPTVVADGAPATEELVHAALPGRPTAFADRSDALPVVCSGGDPDAGTPEVVPVVLGIRRGLGSLFARAFAGLVARTPDWLEAKLEARSLAVMEAEGMYTETLLLERASNGYDLWWYMEAGDMAEVYDAYYESDSAIARVSEYVLGWVLERPERVLANPVEATEFELLAHAVAPDRD